MLTPFKLVLPSRAGGQQEIETATSLLFIGANGSGKTRLGAWIEIQSPQKQNVHRISAQKSLAMPDTSTPVSIDLAEKDLLFGKVDGQWNQKGIYKWHQKPAISLLNDYQKLMVYLFSDHTEESAKYLSASKATAEKVEPPITKLDLVKRTWETILPHRELIIGGLRIQTNIKNEPTKVYKASEMSDGERVIFYLIGQCLAASPDSIIVIDEPELHLHKSVQAPLWAEVEKLRPDCLFVYFTHDVDFAAAQVAAKRVWLKSFDGQTWDWEIIQEDENLPDDLLIEVLGSRKPVIFVEGENGSHDVSLYREVLANFLVIPRGSCSQVIQSVKALKSNTQLHHLDVYGLIDRDRRVPAEITELERHSIFVTSVAEVENYFCTKEVLEVVSKRLARNQDDDFRLVSDAIFKQLQSELEVQISLHAVSEIKFQLNTFDERARGQAGLTSALQTLATQIDVPAIYARIESNFNTVVASKDYDSLLAIYNRKSLVSQTTSVLGLKSGELTELVLRLIRGECRSELTMAIKKQFGNFSQIVA